MGATSDARITPRNRNNHNNAAGSSSHSTTETSTTTTTLDTTTDHHTKPMNVDHPPLRYFGDENENDNYNGVGDSPSKYHRSPKSSNNLLRVMSDNQKQAVILLVLSAIIYAACQFDNTFSLLVIPEDVEGPKPGTHIAMIALLGERNSGTRWTSSHLVDCFNSSIEVRTKLTRYKHWFQYPAAYRYPHETLVIAQFRNPYDWLKAMQHVPHHAPNHIQYTPDDRWMEFLTSQWTMDRVGSDLVNNTRRCQEHFEYKDVISCEVEPLPRSAYKTLDYSKHQPFYEMRNDGSGKPYNNVMEFRSDKIRNYLSIKNYDGIADVWAVQYEYLLTKGTQDLLDEITRWTGVQPNCTAKPPQQRRNRPVEKEMADYIREHLNWTVEAWIGYGPHGM